MIVIIDYDAGNLGSIKNMLHKVGADAVISSDPDTIRRAHKLILPGIGSFDYGVTKLKEGNIWDVLNEKALEQKTPILGVCLGAQLFCKKSEEGSLHGLGWIDADVIRFPSTQQDNSRLRVPHIGWDIVRNKKESKLWTDLPVDSRFYFVHSYYIRCNHRSDVLAGNAYGVNYHSAIERHNIVGVQFHPEKSHRFGKQVYSNFLNLY